MHILFRLLVLSSIFVFAISSAIAGEKSSAEHFTILDSGIVQDTRSGLMWAPSDNGADINWHESLAYSEQFEMGGYGDWRLPTLEELVTLYDSDQKNKAGYAITPKINLSSCCVWSSDESMRSSAIFSFKTGNKPWGFQADTKDLRVVPVRDDRSRTFKHNL